jgi:hypothetical protein
VRSHVSLAREHESRPLQSDASWQGWDLRACNSQGGRFGIRLQTNLPPRLGPRQSADLDRGRWEVELSSKLNQAVRRWNQGDAKRPCSVQTLLHAARIVSMSAALLGHTHHRPTRPAEVGAPWLKKNPYTRIGGQE